MSRIDGPLRRRKGAAPMRTVPTMTPRQFFGHFL